MFLFEEIMMANGRAMRKNNKAEEHLRKKAMESLDHLMKSVADEIKEGIETGEIEQNIPEAVKPLFIVGEGKMRGKKYLLVSETEDFADADNEKVSKIPLEEYSPEKISLKKGGPMGYTLLKFVDIRGKYE